MNKNKRKAFISIGLISATTIPVVAVVSCGSSQKEETKEENLNITKANIKTNLIIPVQNKLEIPSNKIEGIEEIFKMISDNSNIDNVKSIIDVYNLKSSNKNLVVEEISSIQDGTKVVTINAINGNIVTKLIFNFEGYANAKITPKDQSKIEESEFENIKLPQDFKIPNTVTSIDSSAFSNAILPEGFQVPESVIEWGNTIFGNTSMPRGFQNPKMWSQRIPRNAYGKTNLNSDFVIPSTVTSIERDAFWMSSLPNGFKIPETVQNLSSGAFKEIQTSFPEEGWYDPNTGIKHDNPQPGFVWYYEKQEEISLDIEVQGKSEIPSNKIEGDEEILKMISDNADIRAVKNVLEISGFSGDNKNLNIEEVSTIQDGTKIVVINAINGNRVTKLIFNFEGYANAKIAPIDPSKIGAEEFVDIKLPQDFKIPNTVTSIDSSAFSNAILPEGFQVPESVIEWGNTIFGNTSMPRGFQNPKMWSQRIPRNAYGKTNLNSDFVIPSTVTSIERDAFWMSSLPNGFKIPETVQNLSSGAFKEIQTSFPEEGWYDPNTGIKHDNPQPGFVWYYGRPEKMNLDIKVQGKSEIPSNKIEGAEEILKMISDNANNENVKNVIQFYDITDTNKNINIEEVTSIKDGTKIVTIKLMDGDKVAQLTINFEGYANAKIAPKDQSKIEESEFENIKLPHDFKIPNTVTIIEDRAFARSVLPSDFQIPDNVKSIYDEVFDGTTLPKGFKNPKSWQLTIRNFAYKGAILNSDFIIPSTVTGLERASFAQSVLPIGFKVPDTVISVVETAFHSAKLSEGFQNPKAWSEMIRQNSYSYAIINSDFVIPSTVRTIEFNSFDHTKLPNGFKIPESVTNLEPGAFMDVITSHPEEGWYDPNTNIRHNDPKPGYVWYYEKP